MLIYFIQPAQSPKLTPMWRITPRGRKAILRKNVWRSHFTAAIPGGEGSIGFAYRLTSSVSLGITGRLILISKIENISEYTDYYKTGWDPAEPELLTIKQGEEYGGMGWGIGVALIF